MEKLNSIQLVLFFLYYKSLCLVANILVIFLFSLRKSGRYCKAKKKGSVDQGRTRTRLEKKKKKRKEIDKEKKPNKTKNKTK